MPEVRIIDVLDALDEERRVCVRPSLIRLLGLRDAVVLQQIRWHCDIYGAAEVTAKTLADETGLTLAQAKAAITRLCSDKIIDFTEPDILSRRRIYAIAEIAPSRAANPALGEPRIRRSESRESGALPIESDLENEEKTTTETEVACSSFDAFWNDYPKSRRRERSVCEKLFKEAAKSGADIAAGLDRWLDYWRAAATEERFITTSVVWLRHRCWEDDPRIASTGNGAKPKHHASPGTALWNGATDRTGESGEW